LLEDNDKDNPSKIASSIMVANNNNNNNNYVQFERKLELATAGLYPYVRKHFETKISRDNAMTIIDYVLAMNSEIHLSEHYRKDTIMTLRNLNLAAFHIGKLLKELTR
jgi:hypothetical protein